LTNTTTGSERPRGGWAGARAVPGTGRVMPGQRPGPARAAPLTARLARSAAGHWQFGIVLLAAVMMRVVVILGYPPVLWFNDSYNYIQDAITRIPDEVRPNGYPFLLYIVYPLHSWYPVALLQAAMGAGMGAAIYALLRHRGLPWWGAILPALPVLFDSYELHLEHMVTADPLFIFLVTIAVVMLCWSDRPSVAVMAVAGLLIGYATIVRSVGEPLLAVVLAGMLARRAGWRRLVTLAVAGLIPIGGYMAWFHHHYGKYALTESTGAFLYGRVSSFAECSAMAVPAGLRDLCDPVPPRYRPPAAQYIWSDVEMRPYQHTWTPLYAKLGANTARRFTVSVNGTLERFAERAIEAQPAAYLRAVADDTLHTFGWSRQPDPHSWYGNGPAFQFVSGPELTRQVPWYATPARLPGTPGGHYCDASCQRTDRQAQQVQAAEKDFAGSGLGFTRAVQPWERLLQVYQRFVYLRGTLLGVIMLLGAAGIVTRWRRLGGLVPLPWLVAALLIVAPPITAGFSYRYVLAAVPAACLAAGLAFASRTGERSVGALAADLRRHLGRRVRVEQQ